MRAVALTLIACFLLSPAPVWASERAEQAVKNTIDVVLFRPAGCFATAVGAALFVPVAIITLPTGKTGLTQARDIFITIPVETTFTRKLGEW